jgi:integrase
MPKPRNIENRGLPARWQHIHGAYYFQVPPGLEDLWDGKKKFRLGKTLPEAYKVWADRLGSMDKANNVGQLLDRYGIEVVPTKAIRSQTENARAIVKLRAIFGDMRLEEIRPQMIYQYVDKMKAKIAAHREIAVLSHVFTKAVEWGFIDRHPFKGEVRLKGEKPRTRYIEDWEVVECLALSTKRLKGSVLAIQAYMRIKLLTGMRRGDLLRLTIDDLKDDGIHLTPNKTRTTTGKRLIIGWSEELREAVAMAKDARPVRSFQGADLVFCNKRGECYFDEVKETASGWDSMWQRFMTRILKESKVEQRFTEHDLRAKCASDAETLEHARALLAHADGKLTDRVYRRKPERVKPLR